MENKLSDISKNRVDASRVMGVAIGDRAQVIQHIAAYYDIHPPAEGGARITASLKERLHRLLERHTLFGGRDAELTRLNAFLIQRSSGYLFVTGRSGFGKTALLVNWMKMLERDGRRVCYHFISRLDGVADEDFALRSLCQQLVSYHDLSGVLPTSTAEIRSLYAKLLGVPPAEGEKLVVILDGLDEAMGWVPGSDLFPLSLPEGVFVIFSAREIAEQNWLASLELLSSNIEVLELKTLGIAEIASLLQAIGGPVAEWTKDRTFLSAMFEVSEGDPFYLHYLVEDIRDMPITSLKDLEKQPRGLKGYLDKWWKEVSKAAGEQAVSDLLGYLLVAKGRLSRDDLINISDEDALSGMIFDVTLEQVQRYVVGDEEEGYTFCHRRFQDYVAQERIKEREQQPYRQRLLDYCAHWQEHKSNYALARYAEHLVEAGRKEELFTLVDNRSWYDAQIEADPSGTTYLNDIKQAWSVAKTVNADATKRNQVAPLLGREMRCALATASIHSISHNIPIKLLNLLVSTKLWTLSKAVETMRQNPDPEIKYMALVALVPHFPEAERLPMLRETLAMMGAIKNLSSKLNYLAAVAPLLPEPLLNEALQIVWSIQETYRQPEALTVLVPYLSDSLKNEVLLKALTIVRQNPDIREKSFALAKLAPYLVEPLRNDVLREALALAVIQENPNAKAMMIKGRWAMYEDPDSMAKSWTLMALAPHLPKNLLFEALNAAQEIKITSRRVQALAALAPHLPQSLKNEVLGQILKAISAKNADNYVEVFESIAPHLSGDLLHEALDAIKVIENENWRAQALIALAPYLSDDMLIKAMSGRWTYTSGALFFPYLPESLKADVLPAILKFAYASEENADERVKTLIELVPHITEPLRSDILREALKVAREFPDVPTSTEMVSAVVAIMHKKMNEEVVKELTINPGESRAMVLTNVAQYLPEPLKKDVLHEALASAVRIGDEYRQVRAMAAIAPYLPQAERILVLREAVSKVRTIYFDEHKSQAIVAMAPHLSEPLISVALDVKFENNFLKAKGLVALVPHLQEPLKTDVLHEAIVTARQELNTKDTEEKIEILAALAPYIPEAERQPILREALDATLAIDKEDERVQALVALIPHLPEDLLIEAVSVPEGWKYKSIAVLLPHLPQWVKDQLQQQILEANLVTEDIQRRTVDLAMLAPHLPELLKSDLMTEPLLIETLSKARFIEDPYLRAKALAALAPCLLETLKNDVIKEALAAWKTIGVEGHQAQMLAKLAPYLPEDLLSEILDNIKTIGLGGHRAQMLTAVAMYLPETLLAEALNITLLIEDAYPRADALSALVPRLATLPPSSLYPIWCKILPVLEFRTRQDLLWDLHITSPILIVLGGPEAMAETTHAIQDVVRWWP